MRALLALLGHGVASALGGLRGLRQRRRAASGHVNVVAAAEAGLRLLVVAGFDDIRVDGDQRPDVEAQ